MQEEYLYKKMNANIDFISQQEKLIIAGPCTFSDYEEVYSIAKKLKQIGIKYLRAGAFKSRTNPYSFQGLRDEGIEMLIKIKKELNICIVTELLTIEQIKKYAKEVDIIQIGSRNMYNYELLTEAGKTNKPILLKRNFAATYKEWLLAAEYIMKTGNNKVILCERGVRSFNSEETRNVLDIQAIPYIKNNSKLPIIVDPSHASGASYIVESMSKASLVAGADGLIIEVHTEPSQSKCDSKQTIDIETLKKIIYFQEQIKDLNTVK